MSASILRGSVNSMVKLLSRCRSAYPSLSPVNYRGLHCLTTVGGQCSTAGLLSNLYGMNNIGSIRDLTFKDPHVFHTSFHSSSVWHQAQDDYYSVLEVSRSATLDEITESYIELLNKYHAGKNLNNPDAKEMFSKVVKAYKVLSDEERRKQYDAGQSAENIISVDPEELLRETFEYSDKMRSTSDQHGHVMELSFTQAVEGVVKEITLNVNNICSNCKGSGQEPDPDFLECFFCKGSGKKYTGPFLMSLTCNHCHGLGHYFIRKSCLACKGRGQITQRHTVSVAVPAGVKDGATAWIPVDKSKVYLTFKVEESPVFRREGDDVHSEVEISVTQAILGEIVQIKGLYETIDLQIAPGTQPGQKIRLAGHGFAHRDGNGDHYVHIKVIMPKALTRRQEQLMLCYAEEERNIAESLTRDRNVADEEQKNKEQLKKTKIFSKQKKCF